MELQNMTYVLCRSASIDIQREPDFAFSFTGTRYCLRKQVVPAMYARRSSMPSRNIQCWVLDIP